MAQRRGSESIEEPLKAVLLADSFTQRFRPITMEKPKVLLPLVGVPMIDYTLEWLASAGVEEVFVFCCAHASQVIGYLHHSKWSCMPNFKLTCVESHDSISVGDALRAIDQKNVIHGDFVLVSGDTVSNMSLKGVLQEHKQRREKDKLAVMTMVIKRVKPSSRTRLTRLGNEELVLAVDPDTKELLHYDTAVRSCVTLDKSSLADRPRVQFHADMQDCHIDICSPEVLMLFTDNFDYQQMRRDFVRGLLSDEIMGNKLYTYEIDDEYAARVDNLRAYDTVSKDVLHRWTYPLVPDIPFSRLQAGVTLDGYSKYKESGASVARTAVIGENSFIREGTSIGDCSVIHNSVIGRNCSIGSNVVIRGCYVWDNVTIGDQAQLDQAVVCDDAELKPKARLLPGTVLSFKVVIGEGFTVPSYSRISRVPQPLEQDSSDEELEYADADEQKVGNGAAMKADPAEVGDGGAGFKWLIDDKNDWKHSVAAITSDIVKENVAKQVEEEPDEVLQDAALEQYESSDDDEQESNDFDKEVEELFKRAVAGVHEETVVLEVNAGVKLAYNKEFADCASAMFKALLNFALSGSSEGVLEGLRRSINQWASLLRRFVKSVDDEIEILLTLEEACVEGAHAILVAPLFSKILEQLYDNDLVSENAILSWASEKEGAEESDKVFLKQSQPFIRWLAEAEEEEDDD